MIIKTFGLVTFVSIIIILICLMWRDRRKKTIQRRKWIVLFLFPCSQCLVFFQPGGLDSFTQKSLFYEGTIPSVLLILAGILIGLLTDVLLIRAVYQQGERELLQKKLEQETELQNVAKQKEQEIVSLKNEIDELCGKVSEQLSFLEKELLIQDSVDVKNQNDVTGRLLDLVTTSGSAAEGIISAILADKEAEMQKNAIPFRREVSLGELKTIEVFDLCSVFSNLLNNAIEACVELPEEQRYIRLYTRNVGSYLNIMVQNSALSGDREQPRAGRGYGTQILQEIADKYKGRYSHKWNNGEYTATVALFRS